MHLVKQSSLQDQWGLHYVIQYLQWDSITVRDIITTLGAFHLISGFVTSVLSLPVIPIKYAGRGLIPHLHDHIRALDRRIEIEEAWHPLPQRINDDSIMENFAACTRITALELIRANKARL